MAGGGLPGPVCSKSRPRVFLPGPRSPCDQSCRRVACHRERGLHGERPLGVQPWSLGPTGSLLEPLGPRSREMERLCPIPRDGGWRHDYVSGCLWDLPGVNAPLGENGVLMEVLLNETRISSAHAHVHCECVCVCVCVCACVCVRAHTQAHGCVIVSCWHGCLSFHVHTWASGGLC